MGGEFGEKIYMYTYGGVPSLFPWTYHNIINQLYSNIKLKGFFFSLKERKVDSHNTDEFRKAMVDCEVCCQWDKWPGQAEMT